MIVGRGFFYEFHHKRIVSRPGAEITTNDQHEIGPMIERVEAIRQVGLGMDVYTVRRKDALDLANEGFKTESSFHPPHGPAFFPHFHPGGEEHLYEEPREGRMRASEGPGHVFFGSRGEGYDAQRANELKQRDIQRRENQRRQELNKLWGNRHDKSGQK